MSGEVSYALGRALHFDRDALVDHLAQLFSYIFFLGVVPYWLTIGRGRQNERGGRQWGRSGWSGSPSSGGAPRFALVDEAARWPEVVHSLASGRPVHATQGAPVYALWACERASIGPGRSMVINTGVRAWAPAGWVALCASDTTDGATYLPRNLALQIGLRVTNESRTAPKLVEAGKGRPLGYILFVPAHTDTAVRCNSEGRELRRTRVDALLFLPVALLRSGSRRVARGVRRAAARFTAACAALRPCAGR